MNCRYKTSDVSFIRITDYIRLESIGGVNKVNIFPPMIQEKNHHVK